MGGGLGFTESFPNEVTAGLMAVPGRCVVTAPEPEVCLRHSWGDAYPDLWLG